jgi:DNA-binding response OmpR family regulator
LLRLVEGLGEDESVVLVVEDNHALAENLAEALATAGLQTRITGSVAAALAAHPRPRAAIVDFALPDGTGVELARTLKARDPGIKLLFVSGHTRELERSLSGSLAEEARLEKPLRLEHLLEWVTKAVGHGGRATNSDR